MRSHSPSRLHAPYRRNVRQLFAILYTTAYINAQLPAARCRVCFQHAREGTCAVNVAPGAESVSGPAIAPRWNCHPVSDERGRRLYGGGRCLSRCGSGRVRRDRGAYGLRKVNAPKRCRWVTQTRARTSERPSTLLEPRSGANPLWRCHPRWKDRFASNATAARAPHESAS